MASQVGREGDTYLFSRQRVIISFQADIGFSGCIESVILISPADRV